MNDIEQYWSDPPTPLFIQMWTDVFHITYNSYLNEVSNSSLNFGGNQNYENYENLDKNYENYENYENLKKNNSTHFSSSNLPPYEQFRMKGINNTTSAPYSSQQHLGTPNSHFSNRLENNFQTPLTPICTPRTHHRPSPLHSNQPYDPKLINSHNHYVTQYLWIPYLRNRPNHAKQLFQNVHFFRIFFSACLVIPEMKLILEQDRMFWSHLPKNGLLYNIIDVNEPVSELDIDKNNSNSSNNFEKNIVQIDDILSFIPISNITSKLHFDRVSSILTNYVVIINICNLNVSNLGLFFFNFGKLWKFITFFLKVPNSQHPQHSKPNNLSSSSMNLRLNTSIITTTPTTTSLTHSNGSNQSYNDENSLENELKINKNSSRNVQNKNPKLTHSRPNFGRFISHDESSHREECDTRGCSCQISYNDDTSTHKPRYRSNELNVRDLSKNCIRETERNEKNGQNETNSKFEQDDESPKLGHKVHSTSSIPDNLKPRLLLRNNSSIIEHGNSYYNHNNHGEPLFEPDFEIIPKNNTKIEKKMNFEKEIFFQSDFFVSPLQNEANSGYLGGKYEDMLPSIEPNRYQFPMDWIDTDSGGQLGHNLKQKNLINSDSNYFSSPLNLTNTSETSSTYESSSNTPTLSPMTHISSDTMCNSELENKLQNDNFFQTQNNHFQIDPILSSHFLIQNLFKTLSTLNIISLESRSFHAYPYYLGANHVGIIDIIDIIHENETNNKTIGQSDPKRVDFNSHLNWFESSQTTILSSLCTYSPALLSQYNGIFTGTNTTAIKSILQILIQDNQINSADDLEKLMPILTQQNFNFSKMSNFFKQNPQHSKCHNVSFITQQHEYYAYYTEQNGHQYQFSEPYDINSACNSSCDEKNDNFFKVPTSNEIFDLIPDHSYTQPSTPISITQGFTDQDIATSSIFSHNSGHPSFQSENLNNQKHEFNFHNNLSTSQSSSQTSSRSTSMSSFNSSQSINTAASLYHLDFDFNVSIYAFLLMSCLEIFSTFFVQNYIEINNKPENGIEIEKIQHFVQNLFTNHNFLQTIMTCRSPSLPTLLDSIHLSGNNDSPYIGLIHFKYNFFFPWVFAVLTFEQNNEQNQICSHSRLEKEVTIVLTFLSTINPASLLEDSIVSMDMELHPNRYPSLYEYPFIHCQTTHSLRKKNYKLLLNQSFRPRFYLDESGPINMLLSGEYVTSYRPILTTLKEVILNIEQFTKDGQNDYQKYNNNNQGNRISPNQSLLNLIGNVQSIFKTLFNPHRNESNGIKQEFSPLYSYPILGKENIFSNLEKIERIERIGQYEAKDNDKIKQQDAIFQNSFNLLDYIRSIGKLLYSRPNHRKKMMKSKSDCILSEPLQIRGTDETSALCLEAVCELFVQNL